MEETSECAKWTTEEEKMKMTQITMLSIVADTAVFTNIQTLMVNGERCDISRRGILLK